MWTEYFYTTEFHKERDYINYLKNIERLVRSCKEYRVWTALCREHGGWRCAVSGLTLDDCSIEIHHTPYTLFDLCAIVLHNWKSSRGFTTLEIAYKVMELHFQGLVGWVPLTKTNHEAAHSGTLVVPLSKVRGNWHLLEGRFELPGDVLVRVRYLIDKMRAADELYEQTRKPQLRGS